MCIRDRGSFEGDDPAVVAPEEWDEEMDGPWEKPQIRLGGAVKPRFEAAESLLPDALAPSGACSVAQSGVSASLLCADGTTVTLAYEPFRVTVSDGEHERAVLNGRGWLRYEPFEQRTATETAAGAAEEPHRFNGHTDPCLLYTSPSPRDRG